MGQTSRAVALLLLLESASAVDNTIAFSGGLTIDAGAPDIINNYNANMNSQPYAGADARVGTALSSRTAAYAQVLQSTWSWGPLLTKKGQWAATTLYAASVTTGQSSCMACLNADGVWCSRTYAYLSQSSVLQGDLLTYAKRMEADTSDTLSDLVRLAGDAWDGGSCCAANWLMARTVGVPGTLGVYPAYTAAQSQFVSPDNTSTNYLLVSSPQLVEASCVAAKSVNTNYDATDSSNVIEGAYGATTWEAAATAWTSWWCSNGLYKSVTSNAAIKGNFNQQIASNTNKRLELAQVACPQVATQCGFETSATTNAVGLDGATANSAAYVVAGGPYADIAITSGLAKHLKTTGKCTWVAWAYLFAPTFQMTSTLDTALAANWELHTMEYTTMGSALAFSAADGRLPEQGSVGFNPSNQQAVGANFVPLFNMPAASFATLRTWYGAGSFSKTTTASALGAEPANWYAPGQNALAIAGATAATAAQSLALAGLSKQYFGNVANFAYSAWGADFGTVGTQKFDLRQARYLPASAAQVVWASGDKLNTAYTDATTAYGTAKGTWDQYVAILAKNAKQDAFAAMFSPPKAPTVPPLPSFPWPPPAYSGYTALSEEGRARMLGNGLAALAFLPASQPNAQAFWTSIGAAQSVGGWGSFTAQLVSFRKLWSKSFGTIGFSGDAKAATMSQVWNMAWMCTAAGALADQGSSKACQASYAPAANGGAQALTDADITPPNSSDRADMSTGNKGARLVVAVSLWSKGKGVTLDSQGVPPENTLTDTNNSLTVTFTGMAWGTDLQGLAQIAAPPPPGPASSLSGIAGAHALAASTAAALAVAAALY